MFVIAGRADCSRYARAEMLADRLAASLPHFRVHKVGKSIRASSWKTNYGWFLIHTVGARWTPRVYSPMQLDVLRECPGFHTEGGVSWDFPPLAEVSPSRITDSIIYLELVSPPQSFGFLCLQNSTKLLETVKKLFFIQLSVS